MDVFVSKDDVADVLFGKEYFVLNPETRDAKAERAQDGFWIGPHVLDTWDFTTNSQSPCVDSINHGTKVAGMAIYEGDVMNQQPTCKVAAVKLFEGPSFHGNMMDCLVQTVNRFKSKCRVFNLSFSGGGPDPSLSLALDDLAFRENVVLVACAGNIDPKTVVSELQQGNYYPDYILRYPVFFPGDCYNALTVGSVTGKDSNLVQRRHPSPFTRSNSFISKVKPEVLAEGGNLNLERIGGQITGTNYLGCGILSTSNDDNKIEEDVGTSFSCPMVASIAASLADKFKDHSICFYKALILSSCEQLRDASSRTFDLALQGFGVPSRLYALYSNFWRATLYSESAFDLKNRNQLHRYRFLFPDIANRVRITLCYDVEPLLGSGELPYTLLVRPHKPGTSFETAIRPNIEIPQGESNAKQYEYSVQRGGKGPWAVDVYPKVGPELFADPSRLSGRIIRYALVITIQSDKRRSVYDKISAFARKGPPRQTGQQAATVSPEIRLQA